MAARIYLAGICLLCWSCTSETKQPESQPVKESIDSLEAVQEEPVREQTNVKADTIAFETAFTRFFKALQQSDTATINTFIHPTHGLWVIEQPGAMPKMSLVHDIRTFKREFQNRSFLTIKDEVKTCNLLTEAWPAFDCADMNYDAGQSGYSKDGCFVAGPAKFQKSGYWNYASLSEQEIQTIKNTLPYLQKSVLHTATSFEFHFGFIEGYWRLLFTKFIYPCSA
ncbi:hypothetical protein WG947_05005 [Pontibacter sp. H259]|uniref:hypothetical protein n=1 Tax=Pontibacter sp. H259 TaxID=3133421 RepID=UPI0030BFAEED